MALTIPFDIRDIDLDESEKKTIPQLVGEKNAIWISILLIVMSYPMLWLVARQSMIFTLFVIILGIIFIRGSYKHRGDLYFSFIIDGFLILLPLIIFLETSLKTGV